MSLWAPHRYQLLMVDYMLQHPRCAIFAGMGLGKTSSTLAAIDALLISGQVHKPLILAPLRVVRNVWPDEGRKWQQFNHLRIQPIVGTADERRAAIRAKADAYAINFDNLVWLIDELGDAWSFDMVVADESTRLKSFRLLQGGKRAQALSTVAHSRIKRWVNLTGTPAPNGLQDLWGQTWFLDRGFRLGRTYEAFENRWFGFQRAKDAVNAHKTYVKRIVFPHAQAEIQNALKDICLTLDPKDWFDLDEPIVNTIYVDLPPVAREKYRDMERDMFMQLNEHQVEAFGAAAKTLKCLQVANGAAYVGESNTEWVVLHDEKIEALRSVVEEAAGAPVLVAYHFRSDLSRLQGAFPHGRALDADPRTVDDWNAGRIPLLFAHPASAGHGLNLADGGNILVFFAHWWALEERQQILERIGPVRQKQAGHDRPVFIHNIVARDTVDEMVIERIATKRDVQDILLEALKRRTSNAN
jgi:SNF2 family DNA or RNA helicase